MSTVIALSHYILCALHIESDGDRALAWAISPWVPLLT
jgi:hypothetical protein